MIRIEGLNKYYYKGKSNELHVINNTSITLSDTGLVCILGESGSGKTTLMNTVSGLDDFSSGLIEVDGVQIKRYGSKAQERVRNEKFGYIFQNYYLLMNRTVEYNIMLAMAMLELSEEEKEARVEYVLKSVDMLKFKKRLVSQLSGGQQQRVGIARALVKSPKIIFADEPTGNLDEANTMNVMRILKKISLKCLVIIVTHEREIAEFFADKIIYITDGCIESETDREGQGVYQYTEDNNLYLKEYSKKELKAKDARLEIYNAGEDAEITIRIVCENGKLYVSAGDGRNIEFLTDSDERKVIDSKRPVIEQKEVESTAFALEAVEMAKQPKMSFHELVKIAAENRKSMGVKQLFLAVTLFVMSILVVVSVQEILSVLLIKEETLTDRDKRYYRVEAQTERGEIYEEVFTNSFRVRFGRMTQALTEAGFELYPIPDTSLEYQYEGIGQLENYSFEIKEYCFMPIEKMKEEALLYGSLPEKDTEVVLDLLVVEKFLKHSGELSGFITDAKQVIGTTITTEQGISLKVVGISDTKQPDIYVRKNLLLMLCRVNFIFATEEEVKERFPAYESPGLGVTPDGKIELLARSERLQVEYVKYLDDTYGDISGTMSMIVQDMKDMFEHGRKAKIKELLYEIDGLYKQMHEMVLENEDTSDILAKAEELKKSIIECGRDDYSKGKLQELVEDIENLYIRFHGLEELFGVTIEEYGAMLLSDAYFDFDYDGILTGDIRFQVIGYCDAIPEVDYIASQEAVAYLEKAIMDYYQSCYVYADAEDVKEMEVKIKEAIPEDQREDLQIKVVNEAQEEIDSYKEKSISKLNSRMLVILTIFMISMVILYFIMKANAITKIQDLSVYRMLGISNKSILGMFACENFMITSYTSFPGVVITVLIGSVMSRVESLNMTMTYPWYAVILTVLFFYAANILVGILPVWGLLSLPPAQLAAKYDL